LYAALSPYIEQVARLRLKVSATSDNISNHDPIQTALCKKKSKPNQTAKMYN
jgi:hypothetical protein